MIKPSGFKPEGKKNVEGGSISKMKFNGCPNFATKITKDVSVLLPDDRGDPLFALDIIKYEGIIHDVFRLDKFFTLKSWPPVIIIIGPATLKPKYYKRLKQHVEKGGGLITIGLVEPTEDVMGTMTRYPVFSFPIGGQLKNMVGEGYMELVGGVLAPVLEDDWFPLHGFGCQPVMEDGCEVLAKYNTVHESDEEWVAISKRKVGKGIALSFNVDIVQTIRHVQEGLYIDRDGVPPPDAMSPIDDGILKAEDGLVLDWTRDRRVISKKDKVPAFMVPVADCWKRLVRSCIELVADEIGCAVKRIDYWPGGAEFVALISHDTDGNDEKLAAGLLEDINSHGIQTTWCIQEPGYSKMLCQRIESFGHELAFHFDAISGAGSKKTIYSMSKLFTFKEFERQIRAVKKHTGIKEIYSNKNHYTRWEGRNQFLEWCALANIRVDQSKGPSKCGTQGFPFGTCHPWQAMGDRGELIGCLEVCFMSQDFGLQGPPDTGPDFLDAVKKINGVIHIIFHPAHNSKPFVAELMKTFIQETRKLGGKFMTSKEIGKWTFERKMAISLGEDAVNRGVTLTRDNANRKWI